MEQSINENDILAPTQLWKDYDPYLEPLRPSYLKFEETENYYTVASYINGDKYGSTQTRIFVYGYMPKISQANTAIIFINDVLDSAFSVDTLKAFVEAGYDVFTFDYIGKTSHTNYTQYPPAVAYANYDLCGEHLTHANPTARDTTFFVWDKVCMKVISLVKQLRGKDYNIVLSGYKVGGDIALQVAAIDKRVNAVASFLNIGWKDYRNYPKLAHNLQMPIDDERKRWLAGCATESYLKFIKCPTLCVTTTNCSITSIDRIADSSAILMNNKVPFSLSILSGLSDSLSFSARALLYGWLRALSQNIKMPRNPDLELKLDKNGILIATLQIDRSQDVEEIIINYSYDELDSTLRSWSLDYISNQGTKAQIPLYEETQEVFAYVTVNYKNGTSLSSIEKYISIPNDETIVRLPVKKTRIIFQKNMGTEGWLVESEGLMFQFFEPKIIEGPLGLSGLTCESGNLSTYSIGEYKLKSVSQNLLQFDAFSSKPRSLKIQVCSGTYGKYKTFTAIAKLTKPTWTKCSLKLFDFKDENFIPLRSWRDVKKMSFIDASGILLTNIIWV